MIFVTQLKEPTLNDEKKGNPLRRSNAHHNENFCVRPKNKNKISNSGNKNVSFYIKNKITRTI